MQREAVYLVVSSSTEASCAAGKRAVHTCLWIWGYFAQQNCYASLGRHGVQQPLLHDMQGCGKLTVNEDDACIGADAFTQTDSTP